MILRSFLILVVETSLFAVLSLLPFEGAYRLPSGTVVQGWAYDGVRIAFPALFAALLLFSLLGWRRTGRLLAGISPGSDFPGRFLQALRPLVWLPALAAFRHTAGWFGLEIAAMALPLGVPLILAFCAERISRPSFEDGSFLHSLSGRRRIVPFVVAFVALLVLHVWPAGNRFRGGGDVKHYELQTQSLVETGSLDLTEHMETWMNNAHVSPNGQAAYLFASHMRRNENGRIFSVHGYGWPLLAWPFATLAGDAGESFFCILIGAFAIWGVFSACRRCGASEHASSWACAMLGLSWFWVYTSLSRLPEMLGCALCIWGFWATLAQREPALRVRATIVSAMCCAYLPFAHMRFIAIAVVLALAFLVVGMVPRRDTADEPHRLIRMTLHAAVVILAWFVLRRVHARMFAGVSSFSLSEIFLSHPIAMLGIFVDRRGAGGIFPLIWLLALAPVSFLFSGSRLRRAAALLALVLEATTLVACCANQGTLIGACVSARYFLQAIPPLVPFGALWLDHAGRPGRRWWFFLAWMPVLYLFAISPWCSGSGLVFSPYGLWAFDAFRSFWQPLRLMFSPLSTGRAALCLVLPVALMSAPFTVVARQPTRVSLSLFGLLLAAGFVAGLAADRFLPRAGDPPAWAFGNAHHWHSFRYISGPSPETFFQSFRSGENPANQACLLTLLGRSEADESGYPTTAFTNERARQIDTLSVHVNDWAGRDLRWVILRFFRPQEKRRGAVAVRVRGTMFGGTARLTVAMPGHSFFEDGVPVEEGPFDAVLLVPVSGVKMTVRAALDGDIGRLDIDLVDIMPWAPGLDVGAGAFPANVIVANAIRCGPPPTRTTTPHPICEHP